MRDTRRAMSQENVAVQHARSRPVRDQILLRTPFVDRAIARWSRLPPGSPLRRRLVKNALQRSFDAISRNDLEVPVLFYEPDAAIFMSGASALGLAEVYTGDQGWHDVFSDIHEHFVEPRWTVRRVVDAGDRLAAEVGFVGQGKTSGAQVEISNGTAYYFSQRGKVARQDIFWDGWDLALEAMELRE